MHWIGIDPKRNYSNNALKSIDFRPMKISGRKFDCFSMTYETKKTLSFKIPCFLKQRSLPLHADSGK